MNELEVINFQSHLHSYLEFHQGVNIIRGTSHHGKSSLIRAIRWALENEPRGAKFRNWNKPAKEGVESHLSFDQGTVSRVNRSGFNGYLTVQQDVSGEYSQEDEFEALYGDVPREAFIISMMDQSNVWGQDDGYFLIKESPGNVARKLNERAGLEDIDKVAKITNGLIDDFKNKIKFARVELTKSEERKAYLDKISKHKEAIEDIDDLFRQLDITKADMKDLEGRIDTINEIQQAIDKRERILEAGETINELVKLLDRRLTIASKHTKLRLYLEDLDEIITNIEHINLELKYGPLINELVQLFEDRKSTLFEYNSLELLRDSIAHIEGEIHINESRVETYDIGINELMEKYEDIDACPTCGAIRCNWGHEILGD